MSTEYVVEVNNLKREKDTILKQDIQTVLKKFNVDISVDALDIEDSVDTKTAIIHLQSIDEVNIVTDNINNNGFKFTQIAKPYKKITAKRIDSKRPKLYKVNQYLGDETRQREFKELNGNFEKHFLRTGQQERCLATYMCGFVNNREQGTVYIGVGDNGRVVGVPCNHDGRERIRTRIAQIMKCDLNPPISPYHYHINFVQVCETDGSYLEDVYVLEITCLTVDKFDQLYSVNGNVYQRSDACLLGPLKPAYIKELESQIRQKLIKESNNIELKELIEQYKLDKIEKEMSFKRKKDEFHLEVSRLKEIHDEKEKSLICKNDQLIAESEEKGKKLKAVYNQMSDEEKKLRQREMSFKRRKDEYDQEIFRLKQIQEDKERSFKRKTDQLIAEREKEMKLKDIYNQMSEEEIILREEKELSFKRKKEDFDIEVSRLKQIQEENKKSFRRQTDVLIAEREENERKLLNKYKQSIAEEKILREEKELEFQKRNELSDEKVSRLKQIHEAKEISFRRNTDKLIAESEEKEKEIAEEKRLREEKETEIAKEKRLREEKEKEIAKEKRLREEKEKENQLLKRQNSALAKENRAKKSKICVVM